MREQGYKLLPPHLIKSDIDFKIEDEGIRFGLSSIKGISEKNFERVKSFQHADFSDKFTIFSSLKESGLNIGIGSSLIQAGCLDGINKQSRSRMVLELQTWNLLTDKEKVLCKQVGEKNNWDVLNSLVFLRDTMDENGKVYIKASRFETIKKKYQQYKEIYELNRKNEKLANYYYEKIILGYSYSSTLKEIYDEFTDNLMSLSEIKSEVKGIRVKGVGFIVDKPYKGKSKKGTKYMALKIADEGGEIRAKIFSDKMDNCEKMNGRLLTDNDLVIFEGTKMDGGDNMIFCDKIGLQNQKIFMKLSDLSKEKP
jgi:DNA polymerase III alpha subunit